MVHPGSSVQDAASICAQCPLTGAVRISRLGPDGVSYLPGKLLTDYFAGEAAAMCPDSHFEEFHLSKCKRGMRRTAMVRFLPTIHTPSRKKAARRFLSGAAPQMP